MVTAKQFVTVWNQAYDNKMTVIWVADELGITYASTWRRARDLRERGVRLPKLRTRRELDVDALNSILEK